MKKTIRLTESDLTSIIRNIILEYGTPRQYAGPSADQTGKRIEDKNAKKQACYNKWKPVLDTSVKKWKDWLAHPVTKQKWRQNWCKGQFKDDSVCKKEASIFADWNNALNNVRLDVNPWFVGSNTFANAGGDFILHKIFGSSVDVNVNCDLMEENTDPVGLFRHEIQHILHELHPINPKSQVKDVFNIKNDDYEKNLWGAGWSSKALAMPDKTTSISKISKQIPNLNSTRIYDRMNKIYSTNQSLIKDPGYACRATEKESNIVAMRHALRKGPGDNITYEDLKPYIIGQKEPGIDIYWFLACWWSQGFPNINTMLQKANALAYQKNKSPNNQGYQNYT